MVKKKGQNEKKNVFLTPDFGFSTGFCFLQITSVFDN